MENKKNSLLTIIIVFSMFLLMLGVFYYSQYKQQKKLEKFTSETVGTVIKYKVYSKSNGGKYKQTHNYHNITMTYTVKGKLYSVEKKYNGSNKKECNIGDRIDVLYNPNNPEEVIPEFIVKWQTQQIKSSRTAIIVITILTAGLFAFVYSKISNKTKKDQ